MRWISVIGYRLDPRSFTVRSVKPLFDNAPFQVCGSHDVDGNTVQLWAQDADGALTMPATAVLR